MLHGWTKRIGSYVENKAEVQSYINFIDDGNIEVA